MDICGQGRGVIDIFMTALVFLVAIIALIGNSYVILLYCRTRQLREKKRNLFLISLATANVLTSVIAIPLSFVVSFKKFNLNSMKSPINKNYRPSLNAHKAPELASLKSPSSFLFASPQTTRSSEFLWTVSWPCSDLCTIAPWCHILGQNF